MIYTIKRDKKSIPAECQFHQYYESREEAEDAAQFLGAQNLGNFYVVELMEFDDLVEALRRDGYTVNITEEPDYSFAYVMGNWIIGGFCTPNGDEYPYLNYKFAADNVTCYDKWSTSPLVMSFPINYEELSGYLKILGSSEGVKISDGYYITGESPFPYDMPKY